MSNKALNYVWENSKQTGSARVLMLAIADMANDDGECYPGNTKLTEKVLCSPRNLQKLVDKCETDGELMVVEHGGVKTKNGWTNRYIITGMTKKTPQEVKARTPRPKSRGVTVDTPRDVKPDVSRDVNGDTHNPQLNPQKNQKDSVAPTAQRKYLSFAEQHPELTPDELAALSAESIQAQTAKDRERIAWNADEAAMVEAVKVLRGVGGKLALQYAHQMRGTAKEDKKAGEFNIPGGLWSWEFLEWVDYYRKTLPGVDLPKDPEKLYGYITQWLEKRTTKAQTASKTAQEDNWTFDAQAAWKEREANRRWYHPITEQFLGIGEAGKREWEKIKEGQAS